MPIREQDLKFESLEDLDDGRIAMLLKNKLADVARDCLNRPGERKKREVTLKFCFESIASPHDPTICERVDSWIEITSKTPTFTSRGFQMKPHNSGFIFNQDFPEDLGQQSLYPAEDVPDQEE